MIAPLVLAAALETGLPVIRVEPRALLRAVRYVHLRLDVNAYGVAGHGDIVVDRSTGAYVRRFDAGPVSEREGWDGVHAWRADATGMPRIQGNADERASVMEWSHMLAPAHGTAGHPSRPPESSLDHGDVTVVRHVGSSAQRTVFSDFEAVRSIRVPFRMTNTSDNGTWSAHVVTVETSRRYDASTFAPPAEPHDATLDGVTTVRYLGAGPVPSIVPQIAVSVNGGAPLRFLLDTGGQNVITTEAARRAGMDLVGAGTVSGAGPALAQVRYAAAKSVRVGAAELRDQPFLVLDFGPGSPIDGIVGYELLARFAARIDPAHARIELARDVRALSPAGTAVPMVLDDRTPQVDGAIDGLAGAFTLDTGSVGSIDVNTPFVVAHDLRARYHAVLGGALTAGVGGAFYGYFAKAAQLRIGELSVPNVDLLLTDAKTGAEADTSVAGNIGERVLSRYSVVFDYRGGAVRFESSSP